MNKMLLGILALCAALTLGVSAEAKDSKEPAAGAAPTMSQTELRNAMRMLWEEHIVYTRNFIISSIAGLEDAGAITERLLRNQDDIGNAIKPVYGEAAGTKLGGMLRAHILIAANIVRFAKGGANEDVAQQQQFWRKNADEIAVFLSGANPGNWPVQTLKDLLYKHLEYTTTEVVSRLGKNWAADIAAYDNGHAHMLMFADALSDGILKQFPDKFRK